MRNFILLAMISIAAAACSVESGGPQDAAAEAKSGTTVRIGENGAQVDANGAGIRVGRNGIEVDLDRDVELNVGQLRAKVRPGEDGALAITASTE